MNDSIDSKSDCQISVFFNKFLIFYYNKFTLEARHVDQTSAETNIKRTGPAK